MCSFISKAFNLSKKTSTPHEDDQLLCGKKKESVTKIKCFRLYALLLYMIESRSNVFSGCFGLLSFNKSALCAQSFSHQRYNEMFGM